MTGKVIMRIAYGADLEDPKDPYVHFAEKTVCLMNLGVSFSGLLLDLIPISRSTSPSNASNCVEFTAVDGLRRFDVRHAFDTSSTRPD